MKKFRLLLAAGLLLLLTGCFSQSVDELYAPPRAPDDYLKLDNKINEVLSAGGEYAAPLTGELTQKVQLQDLDGDGVKEAIAFFRVSSSERPLKIYIYRQTGDDYEVAAIIEGEGSAINYVSYENLDDSPSKEIVVSWQMMSDQNHSLAAYSIHEDQVLELMRTNYTSFEICDLDQDGMDEIVVIQTGITEESNRVELYNYNDGMLALDSSAPLSRNVTGLPEGGVRTGYLQGNIPAVFVSSTYGHSGSEAVYSNTSYSQSGHITDIFAWKNGRIQNITLDPETGESYTPYVIETSIGVDRMVLAVLSNSYREEKLENGETRVVLGIPAPLAPVKVAVLPLIKKDGLPELAQTIMDELKYDFNCQYDEKDSIGKRYRRQDAIGTPFCVTVDHDSLNDHCVTVRDRDTMQQERVNIDDLPRMIGEKVNMSNLLRRL